MLQVTAGEDVPELPFRLHVFEGNIGRPECSLERLSYYEKKTHLGEIFQMVVGLASGQIGAPEVRRYS